MPTVKLTTRAVESARAPASGRIEYWDSALPGFGLRVTDRGRKSWVMMYRIQGRLRRLTIGHFPALGLASARQEARGALQKVEMGTDPAERKQEARARQAVTLRDLATLYIDRYARPNKPKSWQQDRQALNRDVLPVWGSRPATSITKRDVLDMLWKIHDRGAPVTANRTLTLLKRMFGWLLEQEHLS